MRTALLIVLLFGCGAGAADSAGPRPGDPADFTWGVSQGLWGAENLTIQANGAAHYHFESARGKPSIDRKLTLTAAELAPLRAATRVAGFCALRSERDGIPDEGQPSLTVDAGASSCTVTLWDGEWEEMPAARPALDAVKKIIERMKRD